MCPTSGVINEENSKLQNLPYKKSARHRISSPLFRPTPTNRPRKKKKKSLDIYIPPRVMTPFGVLGPAPPPEGSYMGVIPRGGTPENVSKGE